VWGLRGIEPRADGLAGLFLIACTLPERQVVGKWRRCFHFDEVNSGKTYVTKYLISRSLFVDVFAQENGKRSKILISNQLKKREWDFFPDSW
jgi:hypothetical protein